MSTVLQGLTEAQNAHDAERLASLFAADYRSVQPTHPDRAFTGREQVLRNWTSVFAGVPDFHAALVSACTDGDTEWGEVDWRGHHVDGSPFAMRGVIVATTRDGKIAAARLYVEPVDEGGADIDDAVQELYRPPHTED